MNVHESILRCWPLHFGQFQLVSDKARKRILVKYENVIRFHPGMTLLLNDHPERDGIIVNFEMNLPERGGSQKFYPFSQLRVCFLEEQYRRSQPLQDKHIHYAIFGGSLSDANIFFYFVLSQEVLE
jgi:hypothetical protein